MAYLGLTEAVEIAFGRYSNTLKAITGKDLTLKMNEGGPYQTLWSVTYVKETEPHTYLAGLASWSLDQMQGCCGIVTSYHVGVRDEWQKRGIGAILLKIRMEAAKAAGYTVMTATTVSYNEPECKLLTRAGWKVVNEFKSVRTGNVIKVWMMNLYEGEKA